MTEHPNAFDGEKEMQFSGMRKCQILRVVAAIGCRGGEKGRREKGSLLNILHSWAFEDFDGSATARNTSMGVALKGVGFVTRPTDWSDPMAGVVQAEAPGSD